MLVLWHNGLSRLLHRLGSGESSPENTVQTLLVHSITEEIVSWSTGRHDSLGKLIQVKFVIYYFLFHHTQLIPNFLFHHRHHSIDLIMRVPHVCKAKRLKGNIQRPKFLL